MKPCLCTASSITARVTFVLTDAAPSLREEAYSPNGLNARALVETRTLFVSR